MIKTIHFLEFVENIEHAKVDRISIYNMISLYQNKSTGYVMGFTRNKPDRVPTQPKNMVRNQNMQAQFS